jgi:glycosyltransferase involved in cell wall biosynthesis
VRSTLPNVAIIRRRISDNEVQRRQNECQFHIYPSHYEGFGHAQWEGLSCGAIVFATDGPPFSEHTDAFRLLSAKPVKRGVVTRHEVMPAAIASAVKWALGLTDAQLKQHGEPAREAWERNAAAFRDRIGEAIERLAGPRQSAEAPVVPLVYQADGDLPPFAYVGRVDCVTGQGAAARHQLHVLRSHGLRFKVVDAGSCASPDPRDRDPLVRAAKQSDEGTDKPHGTIIHLQPNTAQPFRADPSLPRPHILVSVWETSRLPAEWVRLINGYDQVWCATEWQRRVYEASGVHARLLRVVPFAVDPGLYEAQGQTRTGKTVFGSVFQWSERKDPRGLIWAYLQAFTAEDPVTLQIKSHAGDCPTAGVRNRVDEIIRSFPLRHRAPRIDVVSRANDSAAMSAFYRSIDCYVSAHRGEGFGFPVAEALLFGKPVIATGWSAPAEYAVGCFRAVRHDLEPPHGMDWQPFYTPDQQWARADVIDLAVAMREAHERRLPGFSSCIREKFASLCSLAGASARAALAEVIL